MKYTLYCDGGCRGNGKENAYGAWACIVLDSNGNECLSLALADKQCYTNIRAEMFAVTEGLKAIAMMTEIEKLPDTIVEIQTDSQFICNAMNKKWIDYWMTHNWVKKSREPVANKELWELLLALESMFKEVTYNYCPGHSGIEYNERCDKLVNRAMDEEKATERAQQKEMKRFLKKEGLL